VFSVHDRRSTRPYLWQKARNADSRDGGIQVFTVTHPFHPLKGQTFEVLAVRNNWGGDRVSYLDAAGRLRTLPVEWTDVHGPDPVVMLSAGRAFFRADLLRQLRKLIDEHMARKEAHHVR
jgi:hypothetical protein